MSNCVLPFIVFRWPKLLVLLQVLALTIRVLTHWVFWSGLRSRKESEVFGWSRIPDNTGSWSQIFLSDSDSGCPIGSFFASHSEIGISCLNGTISFETFVETEISCCVQWFPLILTAKFYSLFVKELEILARSSQKFWKVGCFTSYSATLILIIVYTNIMNVSSHCKHLLKSGK